MRIVVLAYQYGMINAGDFAITLGSIDMLLKKYEKVIVISRYTQKQKEYYEAKDFLKNCYGNSVELVSGPFALSRTGKIELLKSYMNGFAKLCSKRTLKKYMNILKNAEKLYINGGNILRCDSLTDYIRIHALLYPVNVANKCGVPVVFLPQSTTKIMGKGLKLIRKILMNVNTVFIREDISYQYLKNTLPEVNFAKSIDMAFFIDNRKEIKRKYLEKYRWLVEMNNVPIAITLRKEKIGDIGQLCNNEIKSIKKKVLSLVEKMIKSDIPVILVVQCRNDLAFTKEIFDEFQNELVYFIEEYNPLFLREVYRNVRILVGMRLHSLILAASVSTPVIGLFVREWGNKNPGIMEQIKMPYTFITEDKGWEEQFVEAYRSGSNLEQIVESEKENFLSKV